MALVHLTFDCRIQEVQRERWEGGQKKEKHKLKTKWMHSCVQVNDSAVESWFRWSSRTNGVALWSLTHSLYVPLPRAARNRCPLKIRPQQAWMMFPLEYPTSFQKFAAEGLLDPELVSMCLTAFAVCFFQ